MAPCYHDAMVVYVETEVNLRTTEAGMAGVVCSCDPTRVFDTQSAWRQHYESGKPLRASEKAAYAKAHNFTNAPQSVYVSPNAGVQRVNTVDQIQKLHSLHKRLETLYGDVALVEMEIESLVKEIDFPRTAVVEAEWTRSDIKGTCKSCGAETKWKRHRVYHCHPKCRVSASKEEKALLQSMLSAAIFGDTNNG